ncbi:Glycosyl hydrolase, BNR repeat precursor [Limimaricola hongkongensis DSM 17492]|uniref:Glycosyl hydrolase, BNR repeat n=1 Tax=Limimaricola hongkongensis DSM 17492 TaxID=1122180 RepID=A0A017HAF2_9RHOB|nr:Glycosyl hydrolase, BNR repeat precursor [Limimaricola hongkongensis DSM 17492]
MLGATILVPGFARSGPSLAFDPAFALAFDGSAILAATPDGLLRHDGESWTKLGDVEPPNTLSTHPSRPGVIYAGWQDGSLRRSDDSGESWTAADAGLPGASILSLTMAAQSSGILYASLEGDGLWRSEDDGETWNFVMDRPYLDGAEHDVLSLVSVANETGMGGIWLYAGTRAGLTRVPDCFCRWQDVVAGDAMDALVAGNAPTEAAALPAGEPVEILALAPDAPERILAALPSGLWLSTDAGVNWAQVTPDPATALAVDPADPLHVIAAGPSGLRASRDGGTIWTSFDQSQDS